MAKRQWYRKVFNTQWRKICCCVRDLLELSETKFISTWIQYQNMFILIIRWCSKWIQQCIN